MVVVVVTLLMTLWLLQRLVERYLETVVVLHVSLGLLDWYYLVLCTQVLGFQIMQDEANAVLFGLPIEYIK